MTTSQRRDIVVIAASAGGIEVLRRLLSRLPASLPASLLVVLHIPASSGQALVKILDRSGPLPVTAARDGEELRPGHVYIAPPDHHLLIADDRMRLSHGPRQNGSRPAADPLFTSAASSGGARVIGIVLSGTLDDGAFGAAAIEQVGGLVAVQDPAESAHAGMPRAALAATARAEVLPVEEIATLIVRECRRAVADPPVADDDRPDPAHLPEVLARGQPVASKPPGEWSGLTCPECGGPLQEAAGAEPDRYECRVGHGWSAASLFDGHSAAVERALWVAALRLDERVRLTQRMAENADERGHSLSATRFRDATEEAEDALVVIRGLLEQLSGPQAEDDEDGPGPASAR